MYCQMVLLQLLRLVYQIGSSSAMAIGTELYSTLTNNG